MSLDPQCEGPLNHLTGVARCLGFPPFFSFKAPSGLSTLPCPGTSGHSEHTKCSVNELLRHPIACVWSAVESTCGGLIRWGLNQSSVTGNVVKQGPKWPIGGSKECGQLSRSTAFHGRHGRNFESVINYLNRRISDQFNLGFSFKIQIKSLLNLEKKTHFKNLMFI